MRKGARTTRLLLFMRGARPPFAVAMVILSLQAFASEFRDARTGSEERPALGCGIEYFGSGHVSKHAKAAYIALRIEQSESLRNCTDAELRFADSVSDLMPPEIVGRLDREVLHRRESQVGRETSVSYTSSDPINTRNSDPTNVNEGCVKTGSYGPECGPL